VRGCVPQEWPIRLIDDSTRISCYTWADEERGELRVYLRRRDESVIGHIRRPRVKFIMDLPPFLLDFDIEAVLWQSQLSDMRVVITDLGGAIEVAAENLEAFNCFVLRAHESIEATFGADKLVAGMEMGLEVVTTTRSGVPVTPFKRQTANTALEVPALRHRPFRCALPCWSAVAQCCWESQVRVLESRVSPRRVFSAFLQVGREHPAVYCLLCSPISVPWLHLAGKVVRAVHAAYAVSFVLGCRRGRRWARIAAL
jgi:hypothetical protein